VKWASPPLNLLVSQIMVSEVFPPFLFFQNDRVNSSLKLEFNVYGCPLKKMPLLFFQKRSF